MSRSSLLTLVPALLILGVTACQDPAVGLTATTRPAADVSAERTAAGPVVHVVYLVPADREPQKAYTRAIERAIENLQIWYRNALGTGDSFILARPEVQVVATPHDAAWYASTPNGDNRDLWFWFNVLAEGAALTGGEAGDPNDVWVYYIDAAPNCGALYGGALGVAVLPANDLRGLVGEPTIDLCTGAVEPDQGTCRWVGGLGHELGHALGLPHPAGCETGDPSCPLKALMWLGYVTYPDAFLTATDQTLLEGSPLIQPVHLPAKLPDCGKATGRSSTLALQGVAASTLTARSLTSVAARSSCPFALLSTAVGAMR